MLSHFALSPCALLLPSQRGTCRGNRQARTDSVIGRMFTGWSVGLEGSASRRTAVHRSCPTCRVASVSQQEQSGSSGCECFCQRHELWLCALPELLNKRRVGCSERQCSTCTVARSSMPDCTIVLSRFCPPAAHASPSGCSRSVCTGPLSRSLWRAALQWQ